MSPEPESPRPTSPPSTVARPVRPRRVVLLAAVAGAGTMTVELAAVRLIAPWFGATSAVWTNVIGVVLLALALGYLLGARLASGPHPSRRLGQVLLAGAAGVAWAPALAEPVARVFMPPGVALDEAAGLLVWGSLATSLVLFLPAALVLGAAAPLAVECLQRVERTPHGARDDTGAGLGGGAAASDGAGRAGGQVLAASTAGSLLGTFATTHLLVPRLGLTWTFLGAAAVLAGGGAVWLLAGREGGAPRRVVLGLLLPLAALGLSRLARPEVGPGRVLLAEVQSPYQALRVVQEGEGDGARRLLQVNEGLDSFQSVWRPAPGLLGDGHYYDLFALPPAWSARSGTWDLLVLGLGAGTTVRVLEGALPDGVELVSTGVELDPQVVALGREHFDLEADDATRRVHAGMDARVAAQHLEGTYDQVVLDTFANNMEVPPHLCTVEFFREVRERLVPGGWLTVNAAGFGLEDPVVRAVVESAGAAFGREGLLVRVPFSRNQVLFLRRDADVPAPGEPGWADARGEAGTLLGSLELPRAWTRVAVPERAPLTDDRAPIERLQVESIRIGRTRWAEGAEASR